MHLRSVFLTLFLLAAAMQPQKAFAQTTDPSAEDVCRDFSWLVGTWQSYSPWDDQSEPTGGTLVFSYDGGSIVGRIGSVNNYMEENDYSSGTIVFRGFTEVRSYGPDGTTRFESFGGEYYQLDDGEGQWREESIGVRQNGELYISPPAISRLSGHGPFRKSSSVQPGGDCTTVQEPAAETVPAQVSRTALLREILEQEDYLPPVILSPDPCSDNFDGREGLGEAMQDWEGDLERLQELEADRASDPTTRSFREFMDAVIIGNLFGNSTDPQDLPVSPVSEGAQESAADPCINPRGDVILDLRNRMSQLTGDEASDAGSPAEPQKPSLTGGMAEIAPPVLSNEYDPELQVVSVRGDVQGIVPGLFYGETEDDRVANLRDLAERLETIDAADPLRAEFQRNFDLRFDRLEQEYLATQALLRQPDLTEEQRSNYSAKLDRLSEQYDEFGGGISADRAARSLIRYELDKAENGDLSDIFAPGVEAGRTQGRTAEELAGSRAGMRLQSALDRAFPEGWSYDSDSSQIVPRGGSPE
ncbi:hypothetical protein [uncultured Erythrobacter sp.]|uniref:hypothetical protein n=1 Tax=uncultured Erythrobacter sp. TaxID=263913 RepID=UPI00261FDBE4|nr:hypothetical protein [uncultured Erythrobacter sp.]